MRACRLILAGDSRIGKIPKPRSSRPKLPPQRAPRGVKRAKRLG
jgi:hypothetical protein